MKPETKAKIAVGWRKVKSAAKTVIVPLFIGGTIGAAWGGYAMGFAGIKAIVKTRDELNDLKDVVANNAHCQQNDRDKLLELERQQNLLFEKALRETEGKAS